MKLVVVILASVAGLLFLVAAIGALLPRTHQVSRSIVLPAAVDDVYRVLTDREHAPSWRKDLQRVELLGSADGRLHFREHGAHSVTYEVVEAVPGQRLVTRILDRDLGYSGSWTYVLTPSGSGTMLTITENGDVSNVIFRFVSRFVFGHTKTIDTYLAALSERMKSA